MAITKAHQKNREDKALLRAQTEAVYAEGLKASKRVPDIVLHGKQQIAIAWKETALIFQEPERPRGPKSASLRELAELLTFLNLQVARICGKAPLL